MEHYICTGGCHGTSDTAGVCNTEGCPRHGQDMQVCNCTDGLHGGAFDVDNGHEDTAAEGE